MEMMSFPFETLNWETVEREKKPGETGYAYWQVKMINAIRVRIVEYSPGYLADHWCVKGHVLHCLDGELETELADGRVFQMKAGNTYFVGDNNEAHRSRTTTGCKLFIVD